MAWTKVRSTTTLFSGVTTATIALASAAAVGNLVTLAVSFTDNGRTTTGTLPTPTCAQDSWSIALNPVAQVNTNGQVTGGAIFYLVVGTSGTHSSVVSSISGITSDLFALVTIAEWSGNAAVPFDQNATFEKHAATFSSPATAGPTPTLAGAGDLLIGCFSMVSGAGVANAAISDPPAGFTSFGSASQATNATIGAEHAYLPGTVSLAPSVTYGWTDATIAGYMIGLAAFKPSQFLPGAGPPLGRSLRPFLGPQRSFRADPRSSIVFSSGSIGVLSGVAVARALSTGPLSGTATLFGVSVARALGIGTPWGVIPLSGNSVSRTVSVGLVGLSGSVVSASGIAVSRITSLGAITAAIAISGTGIAGSRAIGPMLGSGALLGVSVVRSVATGVPTGIITLSGVAATRVATIGNLGVFTPPVTGTHPWEIGLGMGMMRLGGRAW